ncbi:hypothetical protein K2173_013333 [Erythroxylum novogranatense]|uniref:Pentatricopeptide repeat-containing protein n=1 Tax=Erythroxylum novogranatense TaxID=1862640 RepID=A0AAV8S9R4_9ROSI|nr:hypothetical protein K2173_013333 [Erythroxylum novogranatense]
MLRRATTSSLFRILSLRVPAVVRYSATLRQSTQLEYSRSPLSFFSKALKLAAESGCFLSGKQVHGHLIKSGLVHLRPLHNRVLGVYLKCGESFDVDRLLDEMPVRNVVTWNTVICGYVDRESVHESSRYMGFFYFERMLRDEVDLDSITVNGLLRLCIEVNDVVIGRQLHCLLIKLGFEFNCFVNAALIDFYGKCRLVEEARCVFDIVSCRDVVLWNVMVSCYVLNGLPEKAFAFFNLMRQGDLVGDVFTFSSLLNSCASLGFRESGTQIHGLTIKLSFDSDVLVVSGLVDMYAKNEYTDDARKIFDAMTTRSIVSWNTMVVGYGLLGDVMEAMKLLRKMFQEEIKPDELTLASILSSCGCACVFCETMQVHAYVTKHGFQTFLSVANALVNAYSKCGSITGALRCFGSVIEPDLVTWTSLIGAYAFHGLPKDSIDTFQKMVSGGIRPDRISFLEILSACSHAGLVTEGFHYFNLMENTYRIIPDLEHYTCIVDLLGRAGLLAEAFNILTSMPIKHKSSAFDSFIRACKIHGEVEYGKWAAEMLVELETYKPVTYSLISNLYASDGCWSDVARIRKYMKRGNQKLPGYTWLQLRNTMPTFASTDPCHPQALGICSV